MPTTLARLFGRGRPRKGDDAAYGLRVAAALLESPRPVRVLEAASRLALRTGGCDLALVLGCRRGGGELVVEPLAGQAPGRCWRDLKEALQGRQSPLHELQNDPVWVNLSDDQFQPGAATLRRLELQWLQALRLPLGDDDAVVLLAGRQTEMDEQHALVRLSRLVWHICRDRLSADGPAATPVAAWFSAEAWDTAPAALALVAPGGVEAVNQRARQVLTDNIGRNGAAWEAWLQGAVQRLLVNGLDHDCVAASHSRERDLQVSLSEPLNDEGARLVALSETVAATTGGVTDQEAVLRTLGHELRTPLAAMKTSLSLVLGGDTGPLTADQTRFLGATSRNLDRLNRLLSDLLDAQRADAGRLAVSTAAVDIGELIHQDLALFEVATAEKGLSLETDGVPTSFRACVDADKVQQILHNVVSNAVKYTPRGGLVKVSLLERTDRAPGLGVRLARHADVPCEAFTLLVEDSGMGMSDQYLQRLFEPFSRDDRAEASRLPGAGLGLHITRGLAEAHGGEIRLSSHPGQGTSVSIVLPRDPESAGIITAGRRIAAARGQDPSLQPLILDLRHLAGTLQPWELEGVGQFALRFLDLMASRDRDASTVSGDLGWTLSSGLWLGLARDTERLEAAWQVATAAPETPPAVAGAVWRPIDLDEAPAASAPETSTIVPTPAG